MKKAVRRLPLILPLLVLAAILFLPAVKAEASEYYYFKSPEDGSSFKAGDKIPISFYAGVVIKNTKFDAWGRPSTVTYEKMPVTLKVFKGSTELDSIDFEYTSAATIDTTYTPNTTGTLKFCIYGRNIGLGAMAQVQQASITVKVKQKSASAVKSVKPKIEVDRIAKNKAEISCSNDAGFKMMVYRSTKKNGKYKLIKTSSKPVFTDKKLKASKIYYYKIRLCAKKGKKTYYSKWSSKEKTGKYSSAKITLSYTAKKGVKVTWKPIKGAGYYLVARNTKGTKGEYEVISCEDSKTLTYYDTGVEKGKTYYYSVIAEKGNGEAVGKYMSDNYKIRTK